jgi:hypothetical protein
MTLIAVAVDGVWRSVSDGQPLTVPKPDVYAVDAPVDGVDEIARLLGRAVRLAQNLSPTDARRARDYMHAASAAMTASTYLSGPDQQTFERALRDGIRS